MGINFEKFIKKHLGKATDVDGSAGVQCVDLAKAYLKEVFDIPFLPSARPKKLFLSASSATGSCAISSSAYPTRRISYQ